MRKLEFLLVISILVIISKSNKIEESNGIIIDNNENLSSRNSKVTEIIFLSEEHENSNSEFSEEFNVSVPADSKVYSGTKRSYFYFSFSSIGLIIFIVVMCCVIICLRSNNRNDENNYGGVNDINANLNNNYNQNNNYQYQYQQQDPNVNQYNNPYNQNYYQPVIVSSQIQVNNDHNQNFNQNFSDQNNIYDSQPGVNINSLGDRSLGGTIGYIDNSQPPKYD